MKVSREGIVASQQVTSSVIYMKLFLLPPFLKCWLISHKQERDWCCKLWPRLDMILIRWTAVEVWELQTHLGVQFKKITCWEEVTEKRLGAGWSSATIGHMLNKAGFIAPSVTWVKTGSFQHLKNHGICAKKILSWGFNYFLVAIIASLSWPFTWHPGTSTSIPAYTSKPKSKSKVK